MQSDNSKLSKEWEGKIDEIRSLGVSPYPEKFDKQMDLRSVLGLKEATSVSTAGRIILLRTMGKLSFVTIQDYSGRLQVVVKEDEIGADEYKKFKKLFSQGDLIGCVGSIFFTKTQEKSILVKKYEFLGKSLSPLPEKWSGLKNQEIKYRQRHLDLIANPKSMEDFLFRSNLIRSIREFYWKHHFYEVETPTLMQSATGAVANPYKTKNDALDLDLVLKISHELPLKQLVVGGYDRVFELGKAFRNEGIDVSHLPEHTHLEHYVSYWNYEDNMNFIENMFESIFQSLNLSKQVTMEDGQTIDFDGPWKRVNFIELLKTETGIDVLSYDDSQVLREAIISKGYTFEGIETMSLPGLVDNLYKKIVRPKIINPTLLYFYPLALQPLARRNDHNHEIVDQFQLVVNGWEIVKAYSELVDPIDQEQRFSEQQNSKDKGEDEVMEIDYEYIKAMSYGMPPISGLGLGIDRLAALLLGKHNLRDVVLFPLLKPEIGEDANS